MPHPKLTLSPDRLRLLLYAVGEAPGRTPEETHELTKLFCTLNAMNGGSPMRPAPKEKPPRPSRGSPTVQQRLETLAATRGVRTRRLGASYFYLERETPKRRWISERRPWPTHAQLDDSHWIESTFNVMATQVSR